MSRVCRFCGNKSSHVSQVAFCAARMGLRLRDSEAELDSGRGTPLSVEGQPLVRTLMAPCHRTLIHNATLPQAVRERSDSNVPPP